VRELDEDDAKWRAMRDAPLMKGGRLRGTVLDPAYYAERIRRVMRFAGDGDGDGA
jgi:hypothetical protein